MFNKSEDLPYVRFLNRLHRNVLLDWYLEVGCRNGRTLRLARGKAIGVDPFFKVELNVIGPKPMFMAFQQKSDDFFASRVLGKLGARLSFSFLDGMHLMEFLLRDFMNAEAASNPGGVIAMHDCCPYDFQMTVRDFTQIPRGAWTGDVWKLIPILQNYRPDLTLTVLGCAPTGLVLVTGLDPANTVLRENYANILAEWQDLTLEEYGVGRFYDSFAYTPVRDIEDSDFELFAKVRLPEDEALAPEYVSP